MTDITVQDRINVRRLMGIITNTIRDIFDDETLEDVDKQSVALETTDRYLRYFQDRNIITHFERPLSNEYIVQFPSEIFVSVQITETSRPDYLQITRDVAKNSFIA